MGSQVTAICECGVEAKILIGGSMINFMTTCYFPCLCDSCHNIVQTNLLAKVPRCPECGTANPIPYDDPRILGSLGERTVAEWNMQECLARELILTDGSYKCPKCEKMTLQFTNNGLCWD